MTEADKYAFASRPIETWSSDELENALMWDLIHKSQYDDEWHRRGFGIGPALTHFEQIAVEAQNLTSDVSQKIRPSLGCLSCGRHLQAIGGRRIAVPKGRTKEETRRIEEVRESGYLPWECQICANRVCSQCGKPARLPMGKDILHDDGGISHVAILPVNPGCVNPICTEYKSLSSED